VTTLPLEVAIIQFPEDKFTGEIAPAVADLVNSGLVRLRELVFVHKEEDGTVDAVELSELDDDVAAAYGDITTERSEGLISHEDIEVAGAALAPGASAALLIWENAWAQKFADAVAASGGRLIARETIRQP
jgi:uncharacterized membrane protein